MNETMYIRSVGFSTPHGYVNTLRLHGSGVPAVEAAAVAYEESIAELQVAERDLQAARAVVDRLPDTARAEAYNAGSAGEKPNKAKRRKREQATREAVEDLELDRDAALANAGTKQAEYVQALDHHAPALRANARHAVESAQLELASALTITRNAAAALGGGLAVLTNLNGIAEGQRSVQPAPVPRTSGDDLNDAGHPGVWASAAEEPLTKAIGWTQRHLENADRLAEEAKIAAKIAAEEAEEAAAEEAAEARRAEEERVAEEERMTDPDYAAQREAEERAAVKAAKAEAKRRAKAEEAAALAAHKFATE